MTFADILEFCTDIFNSIYKVASDIIKFFGMTPKELFSDEFLGGILPDWFVNAWLEFSGASVIGDVSIIAIMFGTGLTVYLVYQFVVWLLNIIT